MKKTTAINFFGSTKKLADALGISRHAIYQWPEDLPQRTADEVVGAAIRTGRISVDSEFPLSAEATPQQAA